MLDLVIYIYTYIKLDHIDHINNIISIISYYIISYHITSYHIDSWRASTKTITADYYRYNNNMI